MPVKYQTLTANVPAALEARPQGEKSGQVRPDRRKSAKRIPVHISGSDVPDCPCQLVGIDAGMLYVRSERQIPETSSIVVSFDHVQLSGVVARCQPAEGEWVISVALASCKRRLEERIPNAEESVIGIVENDRTNL